MNGSILDSNQFRIKKVKDKKTIKGEIFYLVSWEHFDKNRDSWITANLIPQDLVRAYEVQNEEMSTEQKVETYQKLDIKSILDLVEIDSKMYFLVEHGNGKSYISKHILKRTASKQLRNFLTEYYTRLAVYCPDS